jgi:glycerol-3-phosphate cytidylyltransferase|tara:strand:+ start:367 stop:777 length:411 start_codon:yes stop_codon:yes gene_type:complete
MYKKLKIGFTASCFDLLHAGHCLMLKDAREQCDWLVVALQSDPSTDRPEKNQPIQSLDERKIQLESLKYVDQIELYETEEDLVFLLNKIKPDVRILGTDYKNKDFTGQELNIEIFFHERNHPWSTSELRRRIKENE